MSCKVGYMSSTKRGWLAIAAMAIAGAGPQLFPATAMADPVTQPQTDTQPAPPGDEVLHNIIYRARVDGISRGATITYAAEGDQVQTTNPTMVPGRTFEANTVLPASQVANMRVSIEWPYSANLHCEILVDDTVAAQADDFIAPRVLPQRDDPDYAALTCETPVSGVGNIAPTDPNASPAPEGPAAPPAAPPPAV
jgi:hypothetical protein